MRSRICVIFLKLQMENINVAASNNKAASERYWQKITRTKGVRQEAAKAGNKGRKEGEKGLAPGACYKCLIGALHINKSG